MTVLSSYIFRQIWGLTLAMTLGLSLLVLLTQSLRFLDLMISAGAAPTVFFQLMALSLPQLVEIILPIALGVSVLIVGMKLQSDQELVVMQATGASHWRLARPVMAASILTSALVMTLSFFLTPLAISTLQSQRQMIQAQFSLSLLQPGVFNFFGNNIMVYFDKRDDQGRLVNLILHDQRNPLHPYTLLAETGELGSYGKTYRLDITNGQRQELNAQRQIVDQLAFSRYGIELPKLIRDIAPRWKEPNERSLVELLTTSSSQDDIDNEGELRAELHRRFALTFLPLSLALPMLGFVFAFARPRAGTLKATASGLAVIGLIQSLTLLFTSLSAEHGIATIALYMSSVAPALLAFWLLRPRQYKGRMKTKVLA